jgi:hypothetical protein
MNRFILCLLFVLWSGIAFGHDENFVTRLLADKYQAQTQVRLSDGSIADMVTSDYAIEVEWAPKWKESIGQSELYATLSGKLPGVILLVEYPVVEQKYVDRCTSVCSKMGIKMWVERIEPVPKLNPLKVIPPAVRKPVGVALRRLAS